MPRKRVEEWLRALRAVVETAERLRRALGKATVILYGSYARGDFNLWSDIDIIVVSPAFRGTRILDRYDAIAGLLEPGIQPVPMTPEELGKALQKPAWRQALSQGHALVVDDLDVERLLEEALGRKPARIEELENRVRRLLATAV